MPTYTFVCETCKTEFEKYIPFSEDPNGQTCPKGHRTVRRIFSAPVIVFKGKGFYVTDNRSAGKK